jgi:hypothetical protein
MIELLYCFCAPGKIHFERPVFDRQAPRPESIAAHGKAPIIRGRHSFLQHVRQCKTRNILPKAQKNVPRF